MLVRCPRPPPPPCGGPCQECAAPEEVTDAVLRLDPSKLKPFPKGDASGIAAAIGALTGLAGGGRQAGAHAR